MRAIVAMMANINFEAAGKQAVVGFISRQEERQLGSLGCQSFDTANVRISKHQSAHARRRKVQHVKAIPAITDELIFRCECQCSAMDAFITQRAATNDNRGAFCRLQCISKRLRRLSQCAQIVAEPFNLVGQIRYRPDSKHLRTGLTDRFLDTRVHQRCFAAQVATDQQDHVRIFDASDGGVEVYSRQRRRIVR